MKSKLFLMTAFSLISANSAFAVNAGIDGHSAGDVIAVKTDNQIVAYCDFSKQIVNTAFNTLCVYNGSK